MTTPTSSRASIGGTMRLRVGRQVDGATRALAQAYATAWQRTRDELVAAAADAERQALERGMADVPAAYRTARLQASLDVLTQQLGQLGTVAGLTVTHRAGAVARVPGEVLANLGQLQGVNLNLPPDRAIEAVVRRTTERIASDAPALTEAAQQELRGALVSAVTGGAGPREAARAMVTATRARAAADLGLSASQLGMLHARGRAEAIVGEARQAFAGGLSRSLNLARTELIDASRVATTASYLANPGLVRGWRWLSTMSTRTCPACWALNNTVHRPEEHQQGHQSCRCTQVPILATDLPGEDDVGDPLERLRSLPEEDQLAIMGPTRLDLLNRGLPMQEFTTIRDNPGWRQAHYVKPLRDLPTPGEPIPLTPTPLPSALPAVSLPVAEPELPPLIHDGTDLTALADDELEALMADPRLYDDAAAAERVMAELDSRPVVTAAADARAAEPGVAAELEAYDAEQAAADAAWQEAWGPPPDVRPAPRTAAQRAAAMREEYDLWVHSQWLRAETETNGGLLTRAAQARGIDPRELFSGPHARAWKHASQELKEWWADNPRLTFTEWKAGQGYGGASTQRAARRAREIRNLDSSL